jgi:hypothetical protein
MTVSCNHGVGYTTTLVVINYFEYCTFICDKAVHMAKLQTADLKIIL